MRDRRLANVQFSICIPVRNDTSNLKACLAGFRSQNLSACEILICDDGSNPPVSAEELQEAGVEFRLFRQAGLGPSAARNHLARVAAGKYLFFIDADTVPRFDMLDCATQIVTTHPEVEVFYGSYDDEPADRSLVSSYKNLLHHFTHQDSAKRSETVTTFWCGCGVIRADLYRNVGGLSLFYEKPSIEDIELGSRLTTQGVGIRIFPELQVKHRKRWTVRSWLYTDLMRRGIPWVRLMRSRKTWGNQLNFSWMQRMASIAAIVTVASLVLAALDARFALAAIAALVVFLVPNLRFIDLVRRKRGLATAVLVIPLHLTYALVCVVSFGVGVLSPPLKFPSSAKLAPVEEFPKSNTSLVEQ